MKIFENLTDDLSTNGLGQITPIKCVEKKRKSLNGWYVECEVELKYIDLIQKDNIVVVETKEKGPQPFYINEPTISTSIVFTADHIIFSSQRYLLDDVRPTNLNGHDFLEWCNQRTDARTPFNIFSDIPSKKTAYFIRKNLLEALEETEIIFDGVFDIDGLNINLLSTIANHTDVSLIYGKNIDGVKLYEKWDEVCTKILPVGPDELILPEKYIVSDIMYKTPYTRTITFSIDKEKEDGNQKTTDEMIVELRVLATKYLEEHKYPKINVTITADIPQDLHIGDIVPVKHPIVNIETDVQAYEYDVLAKRITKIEYGNYERNVQKEFQRIKSEISTIDKKTDNFLTQAKDEVYYLMNVAGKNGTIVFRKNEDDVIYEILAMDSKDISTAKTITRFNSQGIAGTDKGINGQFNVSMLANGTIVADMIKAGTLRAIDIEAAKINGGSIDGTTIKSSTFVVEKKRTVKVYAGEPEQIRLYILGQGSLTSEQKQRLDINQNGRIDSLDYYLAMEIYSGRVSGNFIDTVTINNDNIPQITLRTTNGKNEYKTIIKTGSVTTSDFDSTYATIKSIETNNISFLNSDSSVGVGDLNDIKTLILSGFNLPTYIDGNSIECNGNNSLRCNRAWQVTSDKRLKHDIDDIPKEFIDIWLNLQPKMFRLNNASDEIMLGLLAQDVIKEFEKVGLDYMDYDFVGEFMIDNSGEKYFSVSYDFYFILTSLITKRLYEDVEKLKEKLT